MPSRLTLALRRLNRAALILLMGALVTSPAFADDADVNAITTKLQAQGLEVDKINFVEAVGLYQVVLVGDRGRLFVNADASHFVYGDLFALEGSIVNLSEFERKDERAQMLGQYVEQNPQQLIKFAGADSEASIYIFTDIDCGFCRRMHNQMTEYNDLGIEVNYLSFPRSGPGTRSFAKAVTVWCSEDQQAAMTAAKNGVDLANISCDNQQVLQQYQLGQSLGVNGTPAIVLADGELIAGYLPPSTLLERLRTN